MSCYNGNMKTRELVREYYERCISAGHRPTVREIRDAIGLVSTNTIHRHMKRLGIPPRRKLVNSPYGSNLVVLRARVLQLLGGKCVRCGFSDARALQIDHVGGNGTEERKVPGGNRGMYANMIDYIESGGQGRYQLLCANCNWIKRVEKREYGRSAVGARKWNDTP